jgi:ABC-type uncharacterized transport system auxiliary subunit
MSQVFNLAVLLTILASLTGCGQETAKTAEIRLIWTVVIDPKPINEGRQAIDEIKTALEPPCG